MMRAWPHLGDPECVSDARQGPVCQAGDLILKRTRPQLPEGARSPLVRVVAVSRARVSRGLPAALRC